MVNIEVQTALNEAGARLESEELPVFVKMKKNNVIHHSQLFSKQTGARNSTVCTFIDPSTGENRFGLIKFFCLVANTLVAITQVLETTNQDPLAELRTPQLHELRQGYHLETSKKLIHSVKKPSLASATKAIPPNNIVSKCIMIPIKYSPTDYAVLQPNTFEHL